MSAAYAQRLDDRYEFHIDAGALGPVMEQIHKKTGVQLLYSYDLVGFEGVNAVHGQYTVQEAIAILLHDTGLTSGLTESGMIVIARENSANAQYREERMASGNIKKTLLASASALMFGVGSATAVSAEDDVSADSNADEIIVTSTRREESLQDVPMAVSVVLPEDFIAVGLTKLSDVIAYTPGVSVRDISGRPVGAVITARGVGQQGNTSTVGIYLDAVPLTSNGPWGNGGLVAFDGLLGDVERVEFLKGPQGTLYGSTSIGGAVKYITRKPSLDEFRGHASVDLSGTKEGGFNKIYNGRISAPIIEDKLGVTVAGFYQDNAGFVDRVEAGTGNLIKKNADEYDRYGFSGDLYFEANDRLSFRGRLLHQKADYNGRSLVNIQGDGQAPRYGPFTNDAGVSQSSFKNTIYAGVLEYQFDGATLTASSSYVEDKDEDASDLINVVQAFIPFIDDVLLDRPIGTTTSYLNNASTGSKKFTQEVQLSSDNSDIWEWMLGLYYADEKTFFKTQQTIMPGGFNALSGQSESKYTEYAAFGSLTYYITHNFDATLGARVSNSSMDLSDDSTGFFAGALSSSKVEDTVNTWSFSARYRLDEDMSFYGRVASGYRPASANFVYVDLRGRSRDFVASDTLWSYELGAKGSLADGMFSYDLALWRIEWNNFQTTLVLPLGPALANAEGGITAKGFEGSFTVRPADGLSVISNAAYTKSVLNEDEPGLDGLRGQQLPYVPKWTFSSRARYDFTLSPDLSAYVGSGIRYESSSRSAFNDFDGGNTNIPSENLFLADINAGLEWNSYSLNVYVTNLFNEYELGSINSVVFTAVPVRPRTIGARLSIDF